MLFKDTYFFDNTKKNSRKSTIFTCKHNSKKIIPNFLLRLTLLFVHLIHA